MCFVFIWNSNRIEVAKLFYRKCRQKSKEPSFFFVALNAYSCAHRAFTENAKIKTFFHLIFIASHLCIAFNFQNGWIKRENCTRKMNEIMQKWQTKLDVTKLPISIEWLKPKCIWLLCLNDNVHCNENWLGGFCDSTTWHDSREYYVSWILKMCAQFSTCFI